MVFVFWLSCLIGILSVLDAKPRDWYFKYISVPCRRGLPAKCTNVTYRQKFLPSPNKMDQRLGLLCPNEFDERMLEDFQRFQQECILSKDEWGYPIHTTLVMSIKSSSDKKIISATDSFRVFNLHDYLSNSTDVIWKFLGIKGFDIESTISLPKTTFEFYTDFNLYKKNRIVEGCDEFRGSNSTGFIFKTRQQSESNYINLVKIYKPNNQHPICSNFFRNSLIKMFSFYYLSKSFYLNNMIRFVDENDPRYQNGSVNSNASRIYFLEIDESHKIDIDSRFLNAQVFSRIRTFRLFASIDSIEPNVFKPFVKLRTIWFRSTEFLDLVRRRGIEWIKIMNTDIRVNIMSPADVQAKKGRFIYLALMADREFMSDRRNHQIYDQDFCIFADYPFQQGVFILPYLKEGIIKYRKSTQFSCTELWLYQFYNQVWSESEDGIKLIRMKKLTQANFTACDFKRRLELCKKSNFMPSNKSYELGSLTSSDYLLIFEIASILLASIVSLFGIITNGLTIYVIFHKNNKQTMKEKHYQYASIYCFFNILICLIQLLSLLHECEYPYDSFCSSVRNIVGIQYLKIVFVEYFNSLFRLMSNFTYLAFSFCRMAKIGRDHDKFTVFISELSIKYYVFIALIFSAPFPIGKSLQFDINADMPEHVYPVPFTQNDAAMFWFWETSCTVIIAFNFVFNILNYFLFVLVHLVVDLVLIVKLMRVIKEREEKMKEMNRSEKEIENASKENEESKRRVLFMVIFNSTLNFYTKIPLFIISVNDLRLIIQKPYSLLSKYDDINAYLLFTNVFQFDATFSFKYYCSSQKSCQVLQNYGNCLFLFSLSTILYFLKNFDKNFKDAFETAFNIVHKKKSNKK